MLKKEKLIYLYAIIIGMVVFVAVYGINVLNPCYTDWLFGKAKDLSQHYLGWEFYRKGDWTFPFGLTNQMAYPNYTSVIFTDSIPLFAVFFKLFNPILPDTFQYFGWWGIMCFALQSFFAAKILKEFSVGNIQILLGCVLFLISPTVIEKMFRHTALGGHWIILLSIYLFVGHEKYYKNILRTTIYWGIVGWLIAAIHLYYLPMCGIFAGAYALCSFVKEKKIKIKYIVPFATFMLAIFINTYLLGGFASNASMTSDGLGYYSFNLNGFFNPKGYSCFFDSLNTYKDGQYEGFAYLGLGVFILVLISIIYLVISIKRGYNQEFNDKKIYICMYIFIAIVLVLFAASPEVSFNDKLLFQYPDIDIMIELWSIFRASGRIVWPVCYLIFLFVIICNDRLWKKISKSRYIATLILSVCVLLQVVDLSEKLVGQKLTFGIKETYVSPLQDSIWDDIANTEEIEHIICVSNNIQNQDYIDLAKFAHDNKKTINNFYFARGINVRESVERSLQNIDGSCVYVFCEDELEEVKKYDLVPYVTNNLILGIKK